MLIAPPLPAAPPTPQPTPVPEAWSPQRPKRRKLPKSDQTFDLGEFIRAQLERIHARAAS